ncbi:MAG: ribosome silencing factor [Bacteroides sp.]|nr:ribosome silencing factor [Bacteroides sp.]
MTSQKDKNTETTNFPEMVIDAIQDRKGHKIVSIDLSGIETAAASNFIICEGSSTMQVSAIADNIRESLLERAGIKPYNYDGYQNSQWIVIDYGHTMVHVFVPSERERYNLEELWSDAPATEVPDLD